MKEVEDPAQEVQEVPPAQELTPTQDGAIRATLITEARDRLAHQQVMVDILHTQEVMVATLHILKDILRGTEALVQDLVTLRRDLPTLYPHPDHPPKRKGDSPVVMMADLKVRNLG